MVLYCRYLSIYSEAGTRPMDAELHGELKPKAKPQPSRAVDRMERPLLLLRSSQT